MLLLGWMAIYLLDLIKAPKKLQTSKLKFSLQDYREKEDWLRERQKEQFLFLELINFNFQCLFMDKFITINQRSLLFIKGHIIYQSYYLLTPFLVSLQIFFKNYLFCTTWKSIPSFLTFNLIWLISPTKLSLTYFIKRKNLYALHTEIANIACYS